MHPPRRRVSEPDLALPRGRRAMPFGHAHDPAFKLAAARPSSITAFAIRIRSYHALVPSQVYLDHVHRAAVASHHRPKASPWLWPCPTKLADEPLSQTVVPCLTITPSLPCHLEHVLALPPPCPVRYPSDAHTYTPLNASTHTHALVTTPDLGGATVDPAVVDKQT